MNFRSLWKRDQRCFYGQDWTRLMRIPMKIESAHGYGLIRKGRMKTRGLDTRPFEIIPNRFPT